MKKFNLFPYILIFFTTFLVLQLFQGEQQANPFLDEGTIGIELVKDQYAIGKDIKVRLQNNTEEAITLDSGCPDTPFTVLQYEGGDFVEVSSDIKRDCDEAKDIILEPGRVETISLVEHSYSFFGEVGRYKLELELPSETLTSTEFSIRKPSLITRAWREIIYRPILNALVAVIIYLPGNHLWLSIVILTVFIRTLLLGPSIKAIRAQKRMQEMQPKLEKLKKKYADDQTRLAQETMLLWQKHKVNPMSSCLPILIQFPILIALFYVVSGGLSPDRTILLYNFLPEFSLADINYMFFNFDLSQRSLFVFPIAIGTLQFLQMQLMTGMRKKKESGKKEKKKEGIASEVETANKMMKYIMPMMIAVFASQLPAAVSFYWGSSTFYGILQQLVVNKEGSSGSNADLDDDVKVRVIKK